MAKSDYFKNEVHKTYQILEIPSMSAIYIQYLAFWGTYMQSNIWFFINIFGLCTQIAKKNFKIWKIAYFLLFIIVQIKT